MNDHVRPCNLKPPQRDLTPVLRRPVEPDPKTGHRSTQSACRKLPDSCTAAKRCHSITSSARAITEAGTVMPSDLAVLRLMLRWKRLGCSNGRSAGLAPFKMRSIKEVAR